MNGRGKAHKNLDLIEAAHRILAKIQPATVRAVAWDHAAEIEAAQIDTMEKYAAGWAASISGQDPK